MEEKLAPTATTTDGQIYIVDLRSQEKLAIQFVPEELSISRTVSLANVGVVAMNNSKHHFTGGSKEISFSFFILADDEQKTSAKMRAKWLESLTYQDEITGKYPQVLLIWGKQYKNCKWLISKLSFKEKVFVPGFSFLPEWVEVSITLLQDNEKNELVSDIRNSLAW